MRCRSVLLVTKSQGRHTPPPRGGGLGPKGSTRQARQISERVPPLALFARDRRPNSRRAAAPGAPYIILVPNLGGGLGPKLRMNIIDATGRYRWWYDGIIDWMIANPGKKLYECAEHFGKGASTISLIVNSDAFKMRLAERRKEFEHIHDAAIIGKTTEVALKALDVMLDQLDKKRDKIPLKDANEIANTALQRLGYGAKPSTVVNVGNGAGATVVQVSRETLEASRKSIRQQQEQRLLEVEDAEVLDDSPIPSSA